jgi:hypothetical protein
MSTPLTHPPRTVRNTTRIHPDAKVGNDAIIGGESGLALSSRRRFSVKHNDRHTISWGSIDPNEDADVVVAAASGGSVRRTGRTGLARFLSASQDPAHPDVLPALPMSLRRGVSFAIAEGDEEESPTVMVVVGEDGRIVAAADVAADAVAAAMDPNSAAEMSLVERRRRDGHHRVGSVASDMSADSLASEPHGCSSGEEGPDAAAGPAAGKSRRKHALFRLMRRVSSRGSLRREDSY